jgi:hypothetical protein
MKKRICPSMFMVLAILIWPNIVQALPNERGEYMKLGVGNLECDLWTQARQIGDPNSVWWNTLILGWVQGFLTAYNSYGAGSSDITKETDAEQIARWVDEYCVHHPVDNIAGATEDLISELLKPHRKPPHGIANTP